MASPEISKSKVKRPFRYSLSDAWEGICQTRRTERNFRIHLWLGSGALFLGAYLKIQAWEWVSLLLVIGLVLSAELLNTALEHTVDLVTKDQWRTQAKWAKDAAAAAVLVLALLALAVGGVIFIPYLLNL